MAESSDRELLAAWRSGDERSGAVLFERHYPAIKRFFENKVGTDAEELIQRTFLACLEAKDRFRGDSSIRTFLFGIAHNLLREHFKAKRRDPAAPLDTSAVSAHDLAPGPSSVVAAKQEQRLLLDALRRVPLDYQIALELHYWEHHTAAQIAEVIGLPVGTVKTRLRRGRQLVEAAIDELVTNPELRHSTVTGLDQWVAGLRAQLASAR
ncbi:MAG: sigma-70 family RNA polymerase sigma factor [Nannocystaceae bacterium]